MNSTQKPPGKMQIPSETDTQSMLNMFVSLEELEEMGIPSRTENKSLRPPQEKRGRASFRPQPLTDEQKQKITKSDSEESLDEYHKVT